MTTGERWRLGHRPALDGLRGVAVLLVMVFHSGLVPWLPGAGAVGVTVFFTLSGFLITGLLLEEWDRDKRINLAGFLKRRARRLLPALGVFLTVVVTLGLAIPNFLPGGTIETTLLYVANWRAATGADMGTLVHMWSLSVEEQFYLVFPLLAYAALRLGGRRTLGVLCAVLAALSLGARLWLSLSGASVERIYYGTDTAAFGLLVGCLLAVALSGRVVRPRPLVAVTGVVLLLVASAWASNWTPPIVAALAAVVIAAVGDGSGLLAARWLRLVGHRSYALYLWHLPCLTLAMAFPGPRPVGVAAAVAVAWGIACLSWRYVEQPALRLARHATKPQTPLKEGSAPPAVIAA